MNAQAPAGWYPDGRGNERYWDGSAWTEQLRQPGVADATSAASSSAQKEGAFSKLRKAAADKQAEKRSAREELDRIRPPCHLGLPQHQGAHLDQR